MTQMDPTSVRRRRFVLILATSQSALRVLACQMSSHQRHVDGDVRIGRKASRKRRFDAKMCEPGFALRVASEQAKRARDELDAREVRLEKEQR